MASTELRPDIAEAARHMRLKIGSNREIKKLVGYLWEGETVHRMTSGTYGNGTGLVVLTDRRLFFLQDGWLSQTTEDFPLARMSSVQWSAGVLMGSIVVFASGNKAEIKNVAKEDGREIVDLLRARLSGHAEAPPQPAPAAATVTTSTTEPDVFEQLRKLGELRDAGIVSTEEFEAKKAEMLRRL